MVCLFLVGCNSHRGMTKKVSGVEVNNIKSVVSDKIIGMVIRSIRYVGCYLKYFL